MAQSGLRGNDNVGRGDFRRPSRVMDILPFHLDVGHFLVVPDQAAVIRVPEAVDLERLHALHPPLTSRHGGITPIARFTLRPAIGTFLTGRIREDQSEGLRINVRANTWPVRVQRSTRCMPAL